MKGRSSSSGSTRWSRREGTLCMPDGNHISTYAANTTVTVSLKNRLSGIFPASSEAR